MKPRPREFSLEEANAILPALEQLFETLHQKKEAAGRLHDELLMHELLTQSESRRALYDPGKLIQSQEQSLDESVRDLEKDLEAIRSLGCILRSVERGWVDFLGRRRGEPVYYCWKRGEASIQYYHSTRGSMTDRQPLEIKE